MDEDNSSGEEPTEKRFKAENPEKQEELNTSIHGDDFVKQSKQLNLSAESKAKMMSTSETICTTKDKICKSAMAPAGYSEAGYSGAGYSGAGYSGAGYSGAGYSGGSKSGVCSVGAKKWFASGDCKTEKSEVNTSKEDVDLLSRISFIPDDVEEQSEFKRDLTKPHNPMQYYDFIKFNFR